MKTHFRKLFLFIQQQAVIERFALCEENISILLKWINDIEQRLSKIGGPQEIFEDLQIQINTLKVNFKLFSTEEKRLNFLKFSSKSKTTSTSKHVRFRHASSKSVNSFSPVEMSYLSLRSRPSKIQDVN